MNRIFNMLNCVTEVEPKTNVEKIDNGYLISVLLPGFKKEEIDVKCSNNKLSITAKRQEKERSNAFIREEYAIEDSYKREFELPAIDIGKISASMQDGILSISLINKEAELKKITIS
jgi:HSP20 family protein